MKATINLSPLLASVKADAENMGVSFPSLLTADMKRFRQLASDAVPTMTAWQWGLLSHVLDGIEAHRILMGVDDLPSAQAIAAEIDAWADRAFNDEDIIRAGELRDIIVKLPPLAIAGILMRARR
jgi:hypothetical protein